MAKSKWTVDASHSAVEFSVKHMMFSTVRGTFDKFEANVDADHEDLTTADIEFTIDAASVNTRDEGRDGHLRGADFFDVENYPQITFKSTNVTKVSGNEYDVTGDTTIRGVTKPVTFRVAYEGTGTDPWGGTRAGFTADASLSRKDFGLTWNAALETGGVLVGDAIKLHLEVQAVQQQQ